MRIVDESNGTLVPHHYEVVNMVLVNDEPETESRDESIISFWENLYFDMLEAA
jgi:hypothetical protein